MRSEAAKLTALRMAMFPSIFIGFVNGWYNPILAPFPVLYWAADVLQWIVVPLLVWLFVVREKIPLISIGFRAVRVGEYIFAILILGVAYFYLGLAPSLQGLGFFLAVYMAGTAAVVEEVVFRGMACALIFHYMKGNLAVWVYIIVTTLVFTVVHFEQGWSGMLPAFMFGIAAATVYLRTRSLYPVMAAHFLCDFITFI